MRTWIIPLAVLLVVPALGAATPIVAPPQPENLVEGHTVFTIIEQVTTTAVAHTEYAAAVAVLVREATAVIQNDRFPGVLWFNDQYLVDPIKSYNAQVNVRHPCTGAVLAVNAGGQDPRLAPWTAGGMQANYLESYLITDPNDRSWNVDKWTNTDGAGATDLIWTVAILDNQAGYNTPDDNSNCGPISEAGLRASIPSVGAGSECVPTEIDGTGESPPDGTPIPPPAGGACTPAAGPTPATTLCANRQPVAGPIIGPNCYMDGYGHPAQYNAVLFFFLEDLTVAGADKDHNVPSTDVSGCQVESDPNAAFFSSHWPCPGSGGNYALGDDNGEGNSHVYNPFLLSPVCPHCTGSGNHGGSGAAGTQWTHATRDIDIYYGIGDVPLVRQFRLVDTEGSLAPYNCQEDQIGDFNNPDTDLVCTK